MIAPVQHTILPRECFLQVLSFLDKKYLGVAARVCKEWNALSSSDFVWKPLLAKELPKTLQLLPKILLKDQYKKYLYQEQVNKVDLVLKNSKATFVYKNQNMRIFSEELIKLLHSSEKTLEEKVKAIKHALDSPYRLNERTALPLLKIMMDIDFIHMDSGENTKLIRLMLKAGANPNVTYSSPDDCRFQSPTLLFSAAFRASVSEYYYHHFFPIVQMLVEHGADLTATDNESKTAYSLIADTDIPRQDIDLRVLLDLINPNKKK